MLQSIINGIQCIRVTLVSGWLNFWLDTALQAWVLICRSLLHSPVQIHQSVDLRVSFGQISSAASIQLRTSSSSSQS